jgi:hypothetical protein
MVTSENIRELENLVIYWMVLVGVGFVFSVYHACHFMYGWFAVGASITFLAVHVVRNIVFEIEDQKHITEALENARLQEINELYGENNDLE